MRVLEEERHKVSPTIQIVCVSTGWWYNRYAEIGIHPLSVLRLLGRANDCGLMETCFDSVFVQQLA